MRERIPPPNLPPPPPPPPPAAAGILEKLDRPGARVGGFSTAMSLLMYLVFTVHGIGKANETSKDRIQVIETARAVEAALAQGRSDEYERTKAVWAAQNQKATEEWREDIRQSRELHTATLVVLKDLVVVLKEPRRRR